MYVVLVLALDGCWPRPRLTRSFSTCGKEVHSQTSLASNEGRFYGGTREVWVVLVEDPELPVAFGVDTA